MAHLNDAVYKRYLLAVLFVIQTFNGLDGVALGVLLQDIKRDLALSDTQLGFLSGIAFALFYAVMGIPIARWADRGNRVSIIALTAAAWSVMVALCGLAGTFLQLLLVRIGVAVGESGCVPPAHSLLADNFDRASRPRALATYMMGANLSLIIGYVAAGWLNEFYGWRTTFLALGLPGLLPAALVWFSLKEPRLTSSAPISSREQPSFKEVCSTLWSKAAFRHLLIGFSVFYFFAYGVYQWQPAFFARSYGLSSSAIGTWFAIIFGVAGLVGTYLGGEWATRLAPNNERLQLRAMAALYVGFGVVSAAAYLATNRYWAFALIGFGIAATAMTNGPWFSTIQMLVPPRMRAISVALVLMFANLIGMGFGPLAVGALSDALRPYLGEESLRYALLAMCPGYCWISWHLWRASKTVSRDLPSMDRNQHRQAAALPLA